jgi:hypothetical protein
MAYTALTLITRAYNLSGVVSRELQTVTGTQEQEGLELLNELLDLKGSDLRLIPYWTPATFNTVAGQEMYFVPNLLDIDLNTLTFNLQSVRFPTKYKSRSDYFGTARANGIQSFPFSMRPERVLGGMNIYLYYVPNQVYPVNYFGKFGLQDVTLTTDLSLTFDRYYISYLRYALGESISMEYTIDYPQQAAEKLKEIRKKLMDVSPPDMTMRKMSYFGYGQGLNWAIANISGGYVP